MVAAPRFTYDRHGTPAVWASGPEQAYYGIGFLHGRHRPLQTLLLGAAARGVLSRHLLPRADLVRMDALVQRLDLPARGAAEAQRLTADAASWLDAYLAGVAAGLRRGGRPVELRALASRLPRLDRAAVLSGLMLSAYLGLAEGQERMERLLVDAVAAGGDVHLLEAMFAPHLTGWEPQRLAQLPRRSARGFAAWGYVGAAGAAGSGLGGVAACGGSNAWAVVGERTAGGRPILCGDPHLQINQLPALFFELRARVGDDVWLGATIPGLPGMAVGRNRRLAWSGTFSVADNVDFAIETLRGGRAERDGGRCDLVQREVEVRRRFLPPVRLRFYATDRGVLETGEPADGAALAVQWAAPERAAQALDAYMLLPLCASAEAAEHCLHGAHTLSLHFVLADRFGDVRYTQVGRVPKRSAGWSGLYPVDAARGPRWVGSYEGAELPRAAPSDGVIASANEARPAADGAVLATLAQPPYRRRRIRAQLEARRDHDVAGMQALQLDLLSLQAERLLPRLRDVLVAGPVASALAAWDGRCTVDSIGAHAFDMAYRALLEGLAPELGGAWLTHALATTELRVWWASGFDRLLAEPASWQGARGARLAAALDVVAQHEPQPWGQVQRLELKNLVLGGLPAWCGFDRGPLPFPGSVATVRQGNLVPAGGTQIAVGPAYRMICDLGDDGLWTSLPGGIDGSRFSGTYDRWLDDWAAGAYHRLQAPATDEGRAD